MDLVERFCPDCRRIAAIPDTVPQGFRVTPRQMEHTDPANWRHTDDELLAMHRAGHYVWSGAEAKRIAHLLG